jgi:hypothetical protein
MDSPPVSRRDFCRSALLGSSLVAAGFPPGALAKEDRTPRNLRVSHDGHGDHVEPCLAVNPRDPRNLLAACNLEGGPPATYSTFDGGRTWRSNGLLPLPAGIIEGGNVTVGFDGAGRGLVCALLVELPSPTAAKGFGASVGVWHTDDGGRTFSPLVAVSRTGAVDKPWLATERRSPHTVHVAWTEGTTPALKAALNYARSTDGGHTFEAPRTIARDTRGLGDAMVACGPPGCVYVIYHAGGSSGSPDPASTETRGLQSPATVTVLRSQDRGRTFDRPSELGQTTFSISFPGTDADTLPAIAADPSSGVVCAAFTRHHVGARHADILLAASQDSGRTWSPAKAVTPQDHVIYFEPQVAIDDNGRIGVMAFAIAHGKVSVVLMLSEPRSLRFGPPITITNHPFDPTKSGFARDWYIGSYQALVTTPGAFHPLWNDTRTGQLQLFTAAVRVSS